MITPLRGLPLTNECRQEKRNCVHPAFAVGACTYHLHNCAFALVVPLPVPMSCFECTCNALLPRASRLHRFQTNTAYFAERILHSRFIHQRFCKTNTMLPSSASMHGARHSMVQESQRFVPGTSMWRYQRKPQVPQYKRCTAGHIRSMEGRGSIPAQETIKGTTPGGSGSSQTHESFGTSIHTEQPGGKAPCAAMENIICHRCKIQRRNAGRLVRAHSQLLAKDNKECQGRRVQKQRRHHTRDIEPLVHHNTRFIACCILPAA